MGRDWEVHIVAGGINGWERDSRGSHNFVCPPSLRRWRNTGGGEEGVREGARPLKATGNALRCFSWLRTVRMSLGIAEEVDGFSDVRDIF